MSNYHEFIISAPSGTGKTTLFKKVREQASLEKVVSYTTRAQRECEQAGVDYHFISEEDFQEKIKQEFFLEWAKVYGNYYGTPRHLPKSDCQNKVYEVDVKGFLSLKKHKSDLTSIFIVPPSVAVLKERLLKRQPKMSVDELERRLSSAREEIQHASSYDYIICNEDLSEAVENLMLIFKCEKIKSSNKASLIRKLTQEQ